MAGQKWTKISTYLLNLPLQVNLRATTGMSSRSSEASTNGCTLGVTTGGFFIGFRMASKMSLLPSKATMCRPVPRQAVMHAPASKEIQMPYFHDLVPRLHCKEPHWRYYICMVGYSPVDAVQSKIKSPATHVASRRIVKNLGSFSHPPRQGVSPFIAMSSADVTTMRAESGEQ